MNSERKNPVFNQIIPKKLPKLTARELSEGALCAATAFLLGICALPLSVYPLGIAFFCSASKNAPYAAAGLFAASFFTPLSQMGYLLALALAASLRILTSLLGDGHTLQGGKEKRQKNLFCEALSLRSASAAVAAFVLSLFAVVSGGFRYYDLFGAILAVVCSALATVLFNGVFTDSRQSGFNEKTAHVSVAAALCLALGSLPISGVSAGLAAAFIFTNHFCLKYGLVTSCISSLVCGALCGSENIPVLLIASFTAFCVLDTSPTLAAAVACIAGTVCGVMISGSEYMADPFMSLLLGCALYSTVKKLIAERGERAKERQAAPSPDITSKLMLDCIEERLTHTERLLVESELCFNSPRLCTEIIKAVKSEAQGRAQENKQLSSSISRRLYELGFGRVEVFVSGKRQTEILLFGERIFGGRDRLDFLRRRLSEDIGTKLTHPKSTEYGGRAALLFSREVSVSCRHAVALSPREQVCGDTASVFYDDERNYLYALICDGMGSGEKAHAISSYASDLLKLLLNCGLSPKNALSLLAEELPRNIGEETTVSADLLAVDLYTGDAAIYKCGAAPSYLLREDDVIRLSARTVPMGIISKSDLRRIDLNLRDGDLLVMVSDGVSESENDSLPLLNYISSHKSNTPEEIANDVIDLSRNSCREDDLSVIAVKIFPNNY